MAALKQLREELAAKSDQLQAIFATFDDGDGGLKEMPQAVIDDVRARNTELADLKAKANEAASLEEIRKANADEREAFTKSRGLVPFSTSGGEPGEPKSETKGEGRPQSLGEMFVQSEDVKAWKDAGGFRRHPIFSVEVKTAMTTSAGYVQDDIRTGRVVETGTRPIRLLDLMPNTPTDRDSPTWMEETTFTNNAAPVTEGSAKPESALAYTERTEPCQVIATTLPVTEQQLDVESMIMSMINNRLITQLNLSREDQILNGSGTPPALTGYLNKSGIQTQAKGTDPSPSAIHKAMTKVRWTGYAEPTAIVINPSDWEDIRLLQDSTGNYVWGAPSVAGTMSIFGLPIVVTNLIAAGTALVGDFRMYSELFNRWGVRVEVGYVNDDFAKNRRTLRVESRDCLAIYRAAAFCTVTGI